MQSGGRLPRAPISICRRRLISSGSSLWKSPVRPRPKRQVLVFRRASRSRAMPKQRDRVRMSAEEVEAFLDGAKSLIVATLDKSGAPHQTVLWFAREGDT